MCCLPCTFAWSPLDFLARLFKPTLVPDHEYPASIPPPVHALKRKRRSCGSNSSRGYLTTGFGDKFVRDALNQCRALRRFGDHTCFALVTTATKIVPGLAHNCSNLMLLPVKTNSATACKHERYNVEVMLSLFEITPFRETLFMDSDVLRVAPCDPWKSNLIGYRNQSVAVLGKPQDCSWHWGQICKLEKSTGLTLPHTHAGMMYVRKDASSAKFFDHARNATRLYRSIGFRTFEKKGPGCKALEPHWSYAFGKMGWIPLDFDHAKQLFGFNIWKPGKPPPPASGSCHAHMFNDRDYDGLYRWSTVSTRLSMLLSERRAQVGRRRRRSG